MLYTVLYTYLLQLAREPLSTPVRTRDSRPVGEPNGPAAGRIAADASHTSGSYASAGRIPVDFSPVQISVTAPVCVTGVDTLGRVKWTPNDIIDYGTDTPKDRPRFCVRESVVSVIDNTVKRTHAFSSKWLTFRRNGQMVDDPLI